MNGAIRANIHIDRAACAWLNRRTSTLTPGSLRRRPQRCHRVRLARSRTVAPVKLSRRPSGMRSGERLAVGAADPVSARRADSGSPGSLRRRILDCWPSDRVAGHFLLASRCLG
jgi:hypothetical protein